MTRRLLTIRADQSARLATQMMLWAGVRHLPVVAGDRTLGLLSDRDLLGAREDDAAVKDLLRSDGTTTVGPDTTVAEASAMMALGGLDGLLVMREGELLGVLTATDVLAERGRVAHKSDGGQIPRASAIMRRNVATLGPSDVVLTAIEKVLLAEVRHVPVIDADRRVVGMVSDRDLRAAAGELRSVLDDRTRRRRLSDLRVDAIMTKPLLTASPTASVLELADRFVDSRVGAIPIVDDRERLVGIVSYVDVLAHLLGREVEV